MAINSAIAIPHWLDAAARTHPGKLALVFGDRQWTFSGIRSAVDAAAAVLTRAGAGRNGRIGILSANRAGFAFALHAATRLGIPFVPLNWRQTADEIAWQIQDAGITVLVVDEDRADVALAASEHRPVTIVPIAELEHADSHPVHARERRLDLSREAAVIYTSGTGGRPKGARITYGNLWFSALASALYLGHCADDTWLALLPLFHIGGLSMLIRGAIGGSTVVLHDRFDPEAAIRAIDEGASLVSVVPAMLRRVLDARGDMPWPESLRCVLVGGSAAPPKLIEECLNRGLPAAPTYGLTEGASQVTTLLPEHARQRPSSSGLPLPLTEVRIAGSRGIAAAGETGEIAFRGPTLFAGYLGDGGAHAVCDASGWFRTGDVGYLDDEGYLYVVDRRDDLIVSGGENLYPAEIERVLREHPDVGDAGVVGVPDERWGARPIAAIVWNGHPTEAVEILRRYCAERLAAYKIPDRFLLVSALPRSPSGKLLRRVLKNQLVDADEAS